MIHFWLTTIFLSGCFEEPDPAKMAQKVAGAYCECITKLEPHKDKIKNCGVTNNKLWDSAQRETCNLNRERKKLRKSAIEIFKALQEKNAEHAQAFKKDIDDCSAQAGIVMSWGENAQGSVLSSKSKTPTPEKKTPKQGKKYTWKEVQKNQESIEAVVVAPDSYSISVHGSVKEEVYQAIKKATVFEDVQHSYSTLLPIKKIHSSFPKSSERPVDAFEIETFEGKKGWIGANYFYVRSKVQNVQDNDVLNVRKEADYKSEKVGTIAPNGDLFYLMMQGEDIKKQGCTKQFVSVYTSSGVSGHVNCRYVADLVKK